MPIGNDVFPIHFFDQSDFSKLILKPAMMPNLSIICSNMGMSWAGLLMNNVCPIWIPLGSIATANNRGESGHPCLVPRVSGKGFDVIPFALTLAVGL
uniref:Uncharacterized protein n=1 Tax=Xenopus tropicalis TaxID=8364 RepID=A0A803KAN1_XENTR